jgi:hypothetical protein
MIIFILVLIIFIMLTSITSHIKVPYRIAVCPMELDVALSIAPSRGNCPYIEEEVFVHSLYMAAVSKTMPTPGS